MALFKINDINVKKITAKELDLEKNLQMLFEGNREELKNYFWENDKKSLYVAIGNNEITTPKDKITGSDVRKIIHILDTALHRNKEVTECHGHQIGTKGFMK